MTFIAFIALLATLVVINHSLIDVNELQTVSNKLRFLQVIKPGTHGSTYGGNPLACAVAMEAIKVPKI